LGRNFLVFGFNIPPLIPPLGVRLNHRLSFGSTAGSSVQVGDVRPVSELLLLESSGVYEAVSRIIVHNIPSTKPEGKNKKKTSIAEKE
jgi:hypothetical protein